MAQVSKFFNCLKIEEAVNAEQKTKLDQLLAEMQNTVDLVYAKNSPR